MEKVFFTSDTHFGHANIIKYCGRPFASVEEMNRELIARWNAVVGPRDTVYHLGDRAWENLRGSGVSAQASWREEDSYSRQPRPECSANA
jgi:calcineurin-like phosphoesterase family protein